MHLSLLILKHREKQLYESCMNYLPEGDKRRLFSIAY